MRRIETWHGNRRTNKAAPDGHDGNAGRTARQHAFSRSQIGNELYTARGLREPQSFIVAKYEDLILPKWSAGRNTQCCFCLYGAVVGYSKKFRASSLVFRRNSKRVPWN